MKIEHILKTSKTLSPSKKTVINLIYTTSQINSKLNDVLKPFEISLQQFNVLRILRGQKNIAASLQTVQERMISKMSNTTRLIDKLIKKGYVERKINTANRRKIDLNITSEGLELLETVDKIIDETEIQILKQLTEKDKRKLIKLLVKIRLIAN